jgi:tetratricopeptide (TPR) repeat protein
MIETALLLLLPFAGGQSGSAQAAETARHRACIEKIEANPEQAYEAALAWMGEGGRPGARHCTALALVALGHEDEGAARLEQLANDKDAGTLKQRGVYLGQAGNAWLLAGAPEAAIVTLTNALKLAPQDAGLRVDRARAQMVLKKWKEAGQDLDAANELSPGDGLTLFLRAKALKEMGRLQEALGDIEEARKSDPDNVDMLVLRGDIREAMRVAGVAETPSSRPPGEEVVRPRVVGN